MLFFIVSYNTASVKGIKPIFCDKIIGGENMSKNKKISSANAPQGDPLDAEDMVNKFGTYNIQPTADTKNLFPQISQGLPSTEKNKKDGK